MSQALVRQAQTDIAAIMGRMGEMSDLNVARMQAFARKCISDNPGLSECTNRSLRNAFAQCAIAGLYPDGKQAAVLAFRNNKIGKKEAVFVAGYHGLVALALEHPDVSIVQAGVVYRGETLEVEYGTNNVMRYFPVFDGTVSRTDDMIVSAWAKATINGEVIFHVMSRAEIDAIGMKAPSAKSADSPWKNYYYAQAAKTVFKQLAKWFPKSRKLSAAIDADNAAEAGIDQGVDDPELIEVIENTPVPVPEKEPWEKTAKDVDDQFADYEPPMPEDEPAPKKPKGKGKGGLV